MLSLKKEAINKLSKVFSGSLAFGGFFQVNHDLDSDPEETAGKYRDRVTLTPWDRIKLMWRSDEYGNPSPELKDCYTLIFQSSSVAFLVGGLKDSRKVYDHVMTHHRNEMFRHPREAQIAVFHALTVKYFQSGFKLAVKTFFLSSMYCLLSRTLDVASNSRNPLNHTAAGLISGAAFRAFEGPKAMVGSGLVGVFLGTIEGSLSWSIRYLSGESLEDEYLRKYVALKERAEKQQKETHAALEREIPRDVNREETQPEDKSPQILKEILKVFNSIRELF